MTDAPEPLAAAVDDHDVTLAITPGQLILVAIAAFVLLRIVRSFRG